MINHIDYIDQELLEGTMYWGINIYSLYRLST